MKVKKAKPENHQLNNVNSDDEQLVMQIKQLQVELTEIKLLNEQLKSTNDKWKTKAQYYGEKFARALKGFLLCEGKLEVIAEREKTNVMRDVELI